MSWAEDNGIDIGEVWESEHPSEYWEKGEHLTREGNLVKLSDMTDEHLQNCIRFFAERNWDVSLLQAELVKRQQNVS